MGVAERYKVVEVVIADTASSRPPVWRWGSKNVKIHPEEYIDYALLHGTVKREHPAPLGLNRESSHMIPDGEEKGDENRPQSSGRRRGSVRTSATAVVFKKVRFVARCHRTCNLL